MRNDVSILEKLKEHGVPFVIVGGHAVRYHGYPRETEDVDVVWLRTPESEKWMFAALVEINAQYIGNEIDPATGIERTVPVGLPYVQSHQLMMLFTKFGFVDLFSYVPGHPEMDVQAFFDASIESNGFRYPSREWLIKMKKASGRGKDLLDLENLE